MEYTYHERYAEHVRLIKDLKIALAFIKSQKLPHKVNYIQGSTGSTIRVEYNSLFSKTVSTVTVGHWADEYGAAVMMDENGTVRQLYIKRNRYDNSPNNIKFHMDNIHSSLKAVLAEDGDIERSDALELSIELPLYDNMEENQFHALLQNANDVAVLVMYGLELFIAYKVHEDE